jgi:hypothetical protein
MNCAEVKQHFEAAFDQALTPELERALRLHMGACPSCQSAWDELQILRSVLQSSSIAAPSSSLDARVMSAFHQAHHEPAPAWWRRFVFGTISLPRPAFALAVMAFVLLLVLALYIGRLTATPILLTTLPPAAAVASPPTPQQFVYVPVRAERNARTIAPPSIRRTPATRSTSSPAAPLSTGEPRQLENFTVVTDTGTNYATKATLKGFEPVETASVRIIKGREE